MAMQKYHKTMKMCFEDLLVTIPNLRIILTCENIFHENLSNNIEGKMRNVPFNLGSCHAHYCCYVLGGASILTYCALAFSFSCRAHCVPQNSGLA